MQVDIPDKHIGSKTGLFDFHVNHDINVLVGCGLGGTSLTNANLVIDSDPRVIKNPAGPKDLVADLKSGYKKATNAREKCSTLNLIPKTFQTSKKLEVQEKSTKLIIYTMNVILSSSRET